MEQRATIARDQLVEHLMMPGLHFSHDFRVVESHARASAISQHPPPHRNQSRNMQYQFPPSDKGKFSRILPHDLEVALGKRATRVKFTVWDDALATVSPLPLSNPLLLSPSLLEALRSRGYVKGDWVLNEEKDGSLAMT